MTEIAGWVIFWALVAAAVLTGPIMFITFMIRDHRNRNR